MAFPQTYTTVADGVDTYAADHINTLRKITVGPTMYNALGYGSIADALTAAASGGVVYLPTAFTVTSGLTVPSNVTLQGVGPAATITYTGSGAAITVAHSTTNVHLRDFALTYSSPAVGGISWGNVPATFGSAAGSAYDGAKFSTYGSMSNLTITGRGNNVSGTYGIAASQLHTFRATDIRVISHQTAAYIARSAKMVWTNCRFLDYLNGPDFDALDLTDLHDAGTLVGCEFLGPSVGTTGASLYVRTFNIENINPIYENNGSVTGGSFLKLKYGPYREVKGVYSYYTTGGLSLTNSHVIENDWFGISFDGSRLNANGALVATVGTVHASATPQTITLSETCDDDLKAALLSPANGKTYVRFPLMVDYYGSNRDSTSYVPAVVDGSSVSVNAGGTTRMKADSTGLGFFAATPVAKPTVTGSRGGNAALASLLTKLADLGLITDSTS